MYRATECWRDVERTPPEYHDQIHGQCAFVVATIGLSVSQLLGQNPVVLRDDSWVARPKDLFAEFAAKYGLDPELTADFNWFVDYYDAVRHFGIVRDGSRHQKVEGLTLDVTRRCFTIGRRVWEEVLAVHGRKLGAKIADLDLDDIDHLENTFQQDVDPGPLAGSIEQEEPFE